MYGEIVSETKVKLTLVNTIDQGMAERGLLNESDVRKAEVEAVMDTGAVPLVITEALRKAGVRHKKKQCRNAGGWKK
jgi:hypothetical protein